MPEETRRAIYTLLPEPRANEPAHNIEVNPLDTSYRPYIEEEARLFQDDLKDGKEAKKWRDDAIEAGAELRAGKFDEWTAMEKDEKWGAIPDQKVNDQEQLEQDNEKSEETTMMDVSQALDTKVDGDTSKSETMNGQTEPVNGATTEHVQVPVDGQEKEKTQQ